MRVVFASDLKLTFEDPVFECLTAQTKVTRGYNTMQSDELAHLLKVYSVIAGACIPLFNCI